MSEIKVVIVEDQPVYQDGLCNIIQTDSDLIVTGIASNGKKAIDLLQRVDADVVLLDINMPIMGGLETVPILRERYPDLAILMLTIYDEPRLILKFLNMEVSGYLLKEASGKEIKDGIRTVHSGSTYYGIEVLKKLNSHLDKQLQPDTRKTSLTPRELEVIGLIIQEYTAPEIAKKLFISKETVDTHRKNIREKLQVRSNAGIVREALRLQLFDPGQL